MLEEQELRLHRSECRDKEQQTCDDERLLTAKVRGKESGECRSDDTSDQCRGRGEAMPPVGVSKIL